MKKKIVYITLTLSMLLGGYSFYEMKSSTSLLLSENIEALSNPGDTPDEAISIGSDFEYVSLYKSDSSGRGTRRITCDNDTSPVTWADRNWYKDNAGHVAKKCRTDIFPSLNETWGGCFKVK